VLQTVRQLEATYDREMMQHEIKKVARLVEQGHLSNDILTCPGLLDLPEHHTKWGEIFGSSAEVSNQANAAVGVQHSNLILSSRNSASFPNQGNRVAASASELQQIPGVKSKHSHLEKIDISRLKVPILKHMKAFWTEKPANIHAWADARAVEELKPTEETGKKTKVTIEARLLEWYSDAFMNSLYSVLTHRDAMDSVPLSRENVSACSYTTRAQVAAMLNLVPPSMWNEEMNEKTT
jgi:hypothetical protein